LVRTLVAVVVVMSLAAFGAGCGGSDSSDPEPAASLPSGADLAAGFADGSAAAYEAQDLNRDQDYLRGAITDDCFVLDQAGAEAIAQATGSDHEQVELSKDNYVSGAPGEEETLICAVDDPTQSEAVKRLIGTVGVGTTLADPDQYLERALRTAKGTELEGTAEGLDPAEVVAFEREGVRTFAWVHDDFVIAISGPAQVLSTDAGFAALPVAVEEVSRTLSG